MRHRKTREVVIELTALLDVVIILIFAVMIENAKLVQESQNNLDDANTQIESMQEEMQNVKSSNIKGNGSNLSISLSMIIILIVELLL